MENIFVYEGKPRHKIVLVYDGEFRDASVYNEESIEGYEHDSGGLPFEAIWKSLEEFRDRVLHPCTRMGCLICC